MNILVIGSGGREHAITWKLAQSNKIKNLYVAPGNAGTAQIAQNVNIQPLEFPRLAELVNKKEIDMIVVGPEAPLAEGIFDFFFDFPTIVIGPSKSAARLESSKAFAKSFMQKYGVPTAKYHSFKYNQLQAAYQFLESLEPPYVIKASGLAAGKGVSIVADLDEAKREVKSMFEGKFGDAGNTVVIEEFLEGIELSVFIVTDGEKYKILPTSKDYKRVGEGDTGPNTGGMGAISPMPLATEEFMKKVEQKIIKPTLVGLRSEGLFYRGFLYFGLMKVGDEPYVIEYNVRLGDPETQVVLPRIESDFVELLTSLYEGTLDDYVLKISNQVAATVVLASEGYPGKYQKGKVITGLETIKDSLVFHAGTKLVNSQVLTNGGRVLAVTSLGQDLKQALQKSYKSIEKINFENKYFRADIGYEFVSQN